MTVIPALERELVAAAQREYHAGRRLLRPRPVVGAGLAAAIAALIAAVLALSSGTPAAFAGWTSTPGPATAAAMTVTRAACGNVPLADVVASEARGPFTAIVYVRGGSPWQCVTKGSEVLLHQSTPFPPNVVLKPAPGSVSAPILTHTVVGAAQNRSLELLDKRDQALVQKSSYAQDQKSADSAKARALRSQETAIIIGLHSLSAVSGSIGTGVSGVSFVLRDGTRVKATVGRGWYIAWWPGTAGPSENIPTSLRVTTASGTRTAPYTASYLAKVYGPCLVLEACAGARGTIKVIRGVSPNIVEHFGVVRDTAPITLKQASSGEPRRGSLPLLPSAVSYGLDPSQIHKVSFGSRGTVWVIPGTEGRV